MIFIALCAVSGCLLIAFVVLSIVCARSKKRMKLMKCKNVETEPEAAVPEEKGKEGDEDR